MLDLLFVALLQSAAGEPAPAPQEPTSEAASEPASGEVQLVVPPPEQPEEVRTCVTRQVIGSRMGRRVCSTRTQERVVQDIARETVQHIQRQPAVIEEDWP